MGGMATGLDTAFSVGAEIASTISALSFSLLPLAVVVDVDATVAAGGAMRETQWSPEFELEPEHSADASAVRR